MDLLAFIISIIRYTVLGTCTTAMNRPEVRDTFPRQQQLTEVTGELGL